jgi:short-subunit dehydrogenase
MKNKRIILITGASSGIGLAIGQHLTTLGHTVIGSSRTPEKYPNHPFDLVALDVLNTVAIQKVIQDIRNKYGGVDVLINNAGMGMAGPLAEMEMDPINKLLDVNLKGPILLIQQLIPHMVKQKYGRIINIASIAGNNGLPFRSVYAASKAALMRVTESLRLELRHTPIQCTVLSPGSINTPIATHRYYAPLKENSLYYTQFKNALSDMDNHVAKGLHPDTVALKVAKLIETKILKPHYTVGPWLEKFSAVLKFFLPQRMYENLIASFYNLN